MSLFSGNAFPSERTKALEEAAREHATKLFGPKPPRYSATTISNVKKAREGGEGCQRKYWWAYVVGLEEPASKAQQFGTRGHAYQERYLKHGEVPDSRTREGVVAQSGLAHLPAPGTPGLRVEESFELRFELDGRELAITGTKDFYVAPTDPVQRVMLLGDHKFVKDLKWAMSEAQLADDVQANLYSYDNFLRYRPDFPRLDLMANRWIYYQKEGPRASVPTNVVRTFADVAEYFDGKIVPALRDMRAMVEEKPRLQDVPYNEGMCTAFGGCAHRSRCNLKGRPPMGILSKNSPAPPRPQQSAPPPPQQPAEATQAQSSAPTRASILDRARELASRRGQATDINPPPPPELPPRDGADEPAQAAPQTTPPAGAEEVKARGRKKVAEVAAEVDKAFAQQPAGSPRGGSLAAPGHNPGHDFWLLVGAHASKGGPPVVEVEQIVGAAASRLAAEHAVEHYRQLPYAALERGFAKWLEENALTGVVRAGFPLSPAARDVVGLLRAHASVVLEGDAA